MSNEPDELLRALHDAHGPGLLRYVARMTGDSALAQDIVQESLLRAWQRPLILEQTEDSVRAWLWTVARNLVIDDRRSARFRRESASDVLPENASTEATESVLDAWLLSEVLSSLSITHRRVIVSAYYLGNSVAEIARLEDVPIGTVKSRLHYALRALRLSLQEKGVTQ
jgi:RNA polymerase sigma-70 factor (ECF subfamily)